MTRQRSAFLLSLALLASGSIASAATTGALVDRDGRAVAGATIRALSFETEEAVNARIASSAAPPEALATATTDSRGRFSLDVEAPYFRLLIEAEGFAPVSDRAEKNENIGALLLDPAEPVTIRVDGDGKPIAGAVVRTSTQELHTDDEGKAVLALPKGGGSSFRVTHADWAPLTRTYQRASQIPKAITMSRGVAVRGAVEATDGKPAGGAVVSIDGLPVATSEEDGTFVVSHASADWKQLTATRGDEIAAASKTTAAGYRLRLARGASISGTVVDGKTGRPIVGVPVDLAEPGPTMFRNPLRALSDAKGQFRIAPLPPGSYSLSASRIGYEFSPARIEVKAGERVEKTIAGQQLARITGTVIDEQRKPVGAAAVRIESDRIRRVTFGGGAPPPPPAAFRLSARSSWSSAEGEWVVREAPVDAETKLEAVRAGLPRGESDPMRLASGEKKDRVVLVIPSGITVTGRVLSQLGAPLANATVEAGKRDPGQAQGMVTIVRRLGGPAETSDGVTSGADGTFTMQLAAGTYDLTADAEGYAASSVRAVEVKEAVEPITFELSEAVSVSGRVVRSDGSGVPDVSVNPMTSGSRGAISGPDGSFTIDELSPGSLTLMAMKTSDYIRELVTVEAPASDVVIRIPAGGTVQGRVLEKGSKKPVTDFRAGPSGDRRGGGMRMVMPSILQPFTSSDGTFELSNVPVGQTEIVAEAAGYVSGSASVSVEEGKASQEVTILLEPGTRVFGRVSSPEGTPLSGATVSIAPDSDEPMPFVRGSGSVTTDANGEFTLTGVAPGERSFRATHDSYPMLVKEANVTGREMRLDLQFPRGTDVTGTVVREGGGPVAGAMVSASTALQGGTSKGATTDANGNFRIEGLTPGRYTFNARVEGMSETLRDVDIATSGPVRIVIKAGGTVVGRVAGLQPADLSTANVSVSSTNGYATAPVRNDGTFRVEGAPTGSVSVVATVAGGIASRRQSAPKRVDVPVGGETYVELDFSSGSVVSGRVTRGGAPVDGAQVMFQMTGGGALAGRGSTRTNSRGEYTVEGLEDGTYTVFVMDGRMMTSHRTEYTVAGGGTFDIRMSTSALRGRVIDRTSQEGIAGASISLDPVQQESGFRLPPIQTDTSGSFRIEGATAGQYRLRVTRSGYGQEVLDVSISGDGDQDVEVRMSKSEGVEIRVVDRRDGRALRAFVSAADMMGRLALEEYLDGTKEKLSLAAGAYRAAISVSGYAPTVIDVRSPGGPYVVALSPGGSLRIDSSSPERRRARILDSSGRPIVRGRITMPAEMTVDAAGANVTAIEPGSYTLEVLDIEGGVASRHPFVIVEGQTTTLRV